MTALIEAKELRKSFGSLAAVDGISLTVPRGQVLGFLGPNGAGKSTTMRMITGFLEPDSGSVSIAGLDVQEAPRAAKMRLGYLPEGAPLYAEMTPLSFLRFIAAARGLQGSVAAKCIDSAVEKTDLGAVLGQTIDTLSKGYKRRVGLAQAILHDPEVLIMDEPTDGLDPNQKHQVRRLIAEMAREKAIVVSTHILEEVEAVCTRAVVINRGRIVADGTAEELMRRDPGHGAVAIRIPQERAEMLKSALGALSGIARVETAAGAAGVAELRAVPKNGVAIAADIAAVLRDKSISVEGLEVQRGRLEDVFRQITASDERSRHA